MKTPRPLKEMNVKTVERSLMLLELLARENTALPLSKIAQLAELSVSTTYRMLNTLCRNNFIEKDRHSGHYRLGLKAFIIGSAANQRIEMRSVALPFLAKLTAAAARSSYLATLSGQNVIYTDWAKTDGFLQVMMQTGFPVALHRTASGMVILAHQALRERQDTAQFLMETRSIENAAVFFDRLASIRAAGYASQWIDCAGICDFSLPIIEISAPILNHLGVCSAAISIIDALPAAPSPEWETALRDKVRQTGTEISRALGYGKCG